MWGELREGIPFRTTSCGFDQGINLIDHCAHLGLRAFRRRSWRRHPAPTRPAGKRYPATKAASTGRMCKVERNSTRPTYSPGARELSPLRGLQTDYIDILSGALACILSFPIGGYAATLVNSTEQGKIRAIGVSNYSPAELERFTTSRRFTRFRHALQSACEREIERDDFPYALGRESPPHFTEPSAGDC